MFTVAVDDLTAPDVVALLQLHLSAMDEYSPPEHVHALPIEHLRVPDVVFVAARHQGELAAIGALRLLGDGTGELKSMRAAPAWCGKGAGRAILDALLAEARGRGLNWVGLETGRAAAFAPAHRLYERHGFTDCAAFAGYESGEHTRLMGLALA